MAIYKINMQVCISFFYEKYEIEQREIKKKTKLITLIKVSHLPTPQKKVLEINLVKQMKDLYNE